ncbi:MAG: TetR/AcrR family transcriptional regulator [Oscillospiraceae bacterium]
MTKELSTPRSVQTKNTKEKIYRAAVNIMKKKGFEYLSINNICNIAGVSNGTFFYHFKTKEDLLSYYLHERFAEYRETNNFNVDGLPLDEQIIQYYHCYLSYVEDNGIEFISNYYTPKNAALNVHEYNQQKPQMEYAFVLFRMQEAERQNLISKEKSAVSYAEICCTIIKGIVFDWCVSGGVTDMLEMLDSILRPFLKSIEV